MKQFFTISFMLILLFTAQAQPKLSVRVNPPKNYPWVVLYQLKDVKQNYVDNKQRNQDSLFVFDMSKQPSGMYLLMYDMDARNFIYFLFNKKNVALNVFPYQHNKVEILQSKENKVYLPYAGQQAALIHQLNKLENNLVDQKLTGKDSLHFVRLKRKLDSLQQLYEKKSKGLLAHTYIQNKFEYYPDFQGDKKVYFKDKTTHYFDRLDFNNADLKRSNVIIDKINRYVFGINPPQNPKTKHLEYMRRIESILPKIKDRTYRNNVIFSLTSSFIPVDGRVSKMLIKKYIDKMPAAEKSSFNTQSILDQIGLTIGEQAPDFSFKDLKGHQYDLYKVTKKKPYTLLIFWSATCPHCLHAMPKIQKMFKNRKDFNVVAIGLESETYPWSSEHQYYPEFYHGIKMKKWDNPIVKTYGIHATPTFFVLNSKNEIIAEPYEVKDIQQFLDKLHKK